MSRLARYTAVLDACQYNVAKTDVTVLCSGDYTDHFSGPDRAISLMCVCRDKTITFKLNEL